MTLKNPIKYGDPILILFHFCFLSSLANTVFYILSGNTALTCWNIADTVLYLLFLAEYKRWNKLVMITLFVYDTTANSLFSLFLTGTDPWNEMLVLGQIPALYLFTTQMKTPRHYRSISVSIVIAAAVFIAAYRLNLKPFTDTQLLLDSDFRFMVLENILLTAGETVLAYWKASEAIAVSRTKTEEEHAQMEYIATHDPLTNLLNRRGIAEVFKTCSETKQKENIDYAVCIFDIDNFKSVNDSYGHDSGDYILVNFTQAIKERLPKDTTMGRWGGEEFLIIYPRFTQDTIYELDQIREKTSAQAFVLNGIPVHISATFGISSSRCLNSPDAILSDADYNLLQGKDHGKNRLVVSEKF